MSHQNNSNDNTVPSLENGTFRHPMRPPQRPGQNMVNSSLLAYVESGVGQQGGFGSHQEQWLLGEGAYRNRDRPEYYPGYNQQSVPVPMESIRYVFLFHPTTGDVYRPTGENIYYGPIAGAENYHQPQAAVVYQPPDFYQPRANNFNQPRYENYYPATPGSIHHPITANGHQQVVGSFNQPRNEYFFPMPAAVMERPEPAAFEDPDHLPEPIAIVEHAALPAPVPVPAHVALPMLAAIPERPVPAAIVEHAHVSEHAVLPAPAPVPAHVALPMLAAIPELPEPAAIEDPDQLPEPIAIEEHAVLPAPAPVPAHVALPMLAAIPELPEPAAIEDPDQLPEPIAIEEHAVLPAPAPVPAHVALPMLAAIPELPEHAAFEEQDDRLVAHFNQFGNIADAAEAYHPEPVAPVEPFAFVEPVASVLEHLAQPMHAGLPEHASLAEVAAADPPELDVQDDRDLELGNLPEPDNLPEPAGPSGVHQNPKQRNKNNKKKNKNKKNAPQQLTKAEKKAAEAEERKCFEEARALVAQERRVEKEKMLKILREYIANQKIIRKKLYQHTHGLGKLIPNNLQSEILTWYTKVVHYNWKNGRTVVDNALKERMALHPENYKKHVQFSLLVEELGEVIIQDILALTEIKEGNVPKYEDDYLDFVFNPNRPTVEIVKMNKKCRNPNSAIVEDPKWCLIKMKKLLEAHVARQYEIRKGDVDLSKVEWKSDIEKYLAGQYVQKNGETGATDRDDAKSRHIGHWRIIWCVNVRTIPEEKKTEKDFLVDHFLNIMMNSDEEMLFFDSIQMADMPKEGKNLTDITLEYFQTLFGFDM